MTKPSPSPPTRVPAGTHPRDLVALWMAATYRLVLLCALAQVVFRRAANVGYIVQKLADGGLLELHARALPGRVSFATITPRGCALLGLREERAKPVQGQTLDLCISVLWHCTMGEQRRYRLEPGELRALFGDNHPLPPNTVHIASASEPGKDSEHPVVYRCYLATAQVTNCVKHLRGFVEQAMSAPGLRPWVEAFDYRFLSFVEQPSKRDALLRAISRHGELTGLCEVALAPTGSTVSKFVKHTKDKP